VNTTPSAVLVKAALKKMYGGCTKFGCAAPTSIFAGQQFSEELEKENRAISNLNVTMDNSGKGTNYDGGVASTHFNGIPVIWDPTFELLDAKYTPATLYTKRAYMVSDAALTLRPVQGFWMLDRKPPRMYDRYVHYWARTSSYRLTTDRRNGLAVLTIA